VVTTSTDGPTSLVDQVPVVAHVAIDYVLAAFLIAAPFLFEASTIRPSRSSSSSRSGSRTS
jgi:hypothetical protein